MYVQVFLLLTFLERRKEIIPTDIHPDKVTLPPVTIVVPCWNEENTVAKTVGSLLALDYPKDKLHILLVDDGSVDNTWNEMQKFKDTPQIEMIQKENGGKHTAMNIGIQNAKTPFIGCLDADSFTEPDALRKIMAHFKDPTVMAVSPSILAYKPENFIQKAQNVQYDMAVFIKKLLGMINGIHVTPGPFSFYRKEVFEKIGLYRKAHNTEDMEIAYRMQVNKMKIAQCHDAFVYSVVPRTIKTLFMQQLRWMYGFINNTLDYRKYLFKKEYGTFSMFTVPWGTLGAFSVIIFFVISTISIISRVVKYAQQLLVTDFFVPSLSTRVAIDPFFIDTRPLTFITILLTISVFGMVLAGMRMRQKQPLPNISFLYFLLVYSVIAPFWFLKALYNTLLSRETTWR